MKKFYNKGISEIKLQNDEIVNLGNNPSGIFVYNENGEIVGFQSYDNCLFYGVNEVKAVRFIDDDKVYSVGELADEVFFNYENEYIDKKTISERFEAILFTNEEWEKLRSEIGNEPTINNFFLFLSEKNKSGDISIDEITYILGYGRYIHCNEDCPYNIYELNSYPYSIVEAENETAIIGETYFSID